MAANLQYTIQNAHSPADTKIIELRGDIDESNQATLEKLMEELLHDSSVRYVVFNLENLDYINSGVIGYFANVHVQFVEQDKSFVFAQTNQNIFDIIDLVGLNSVIECFDSVEEACLSFED